jgi:hypothetical protein
MVASSSRVKLFRGAGTISLRARMESSQDGRTRAPIFDAVYQRQG